MEQKDPKNSVHNPNEQFSKEAENEKEERKKSQTTENSLSQEKQQNKEEKESHADSEEESAGKNRQETRDQSTGSEEDENKKSQTSPETDKEGSKKDESDQETGNAEEPGKTLSESRRPEEYSDSGSGKKDAEKPKEQPAKDESRDLSQAKETEREEDKKKPEALPKKEEINYSLLSKPDLLEIFKELLHEGKINQIGKDVAAIKSAFYRKIHAEIEEKKEKFFREGGNEADFSPGVSEEEEELKALLKKYAELRTEYNRLREDEKKENLEKKHQIIEEIKELANRDEAINITFQEFRDLQRRWHEIGAVPQEELKNLWETYHYYVEKFYDYIKINKELRDLDLRKNLETKIKLCEKAEELILEPNIVNAFKTLQKYHDQWREIGPVPREKRTEIWERFKEATSKINKKHQQYYQELKETQKKNLESKKVLCEKAETLAEMEIEDHSTWVEKTREIFEIQKVWKTIGFAPKKDNNKIYARFRQACDTFFDKKREYYAKGLEEQQENLQKKMDLCIQAEALQDSTDWKKTTSELIELQKKWKRIGPVPRKKSDQIWKRFRSACDQFFNRKSEFFANIEERYEDNLKKKQELIQEIKDFIPVESQKENLAKLNEFQKRWSNIGFVPYDKKESIMQEFRDAINQQYDKMEMDDHRKNVLKFKNKLESIKNKPRPGNKLRFEREKLMNKLQQLRNDIVLWENNIGFFTESKKADSMIRDFEKKIQDAKNKIKLLEDKITMIDEVEEEG
ncbi:MAG: DUF349 domain-containing protein [Bacteroidota bacterium]